MTKKPSYPKTLTYRELYEKYEKAKIFGMSHNPSKPDYKPEQCPRCEKYYDRLLGCPNICPDCIKEKRARNRICY